MLYVTHITIFFYEFFRFLKLLKPLVESFNIYSYQLIVEENYIKTNNFGINIRQPTTIAIIAEINTAAAL